MYKQKVNGLVLIYIYKLGPWIIDKLNLNNKWTHKKCGFIFGATFGPFRHPKYYISDQIWNP